MRIAVIGVLLVPLTYAQGPREAEFERARNIVSKTMDDLRHVERHDQFAPEDRERYQRATRDLEDMRRDLDDHRLDRERLDRAIEEIERVARVDTVGERERRELMGDVRELRRLRDDWHY
ncbi:MAG TPA: hypothetical protein VKX39_12235 [Bryobacteraceae bacterium]|nr:hypothetical protein [Bryobacteraceae bacterium]